MSNDPHTVAKIQHAVSELRTLVVQLSSQTQPAPAPSNAKKLTKRDVVVIRQMHRAGTKQSEIADIYDVNHGTISRIIRHQYHK